MAEPVIISYARGLLKEFPGVPEGTVDVIPVDLVVGAICAVAAARPRSGAVASCRWHRGRRTRCATAASSTSCTSGSASIRSTTAPGSRSWSRRGRSPAAAGCRGSSAGPSDCSSGPRRRSQCCRCAARGRRCQRPPRGAARATSSGRSSYVELYGAYAECEAIYRRRPPDGGVGSARRRRSRELLRSTRRRSTGRTTSPRCTCRRSCSRRGCARRPAVAAARLARNGCAPRSSPPGVTSPRSTSRTRSSRRTSSSRYAWLATPSARQRRSAARSSPKTRRARRRPCSRSTKTGPRRLPPLLLPPLRGRAGRSARRGRHRADAATLILTKSFPAAIRRVREHRALGHRTLLITGALDFVVKPLLPLFDDVVCAHLGVDCRRQVHRRARRRPADRRGPRQVMADYAAAEGLELSGVGRLRRLRPPTCRCSRRSASRSR